MASDLPDAVKELRFALNELPGPGRTLLSELLAAYCGCCGNEAGSDDEWCLRCRSHIADHGPAWDRTWYAQHGTHCPHQWYPQHEGEGSRGA